MGAWVAMWMVIGGIVTWSYFTFEMTDQEKIIIFVFMTFWVYYAIRVTRTFLWLMWGTEFLKIDDVAMTVKKSIKGYGRAVPYYIENIQKMQMYVPEQGSFQATWEASPWIRGGERIEFEYMRKMIRLGRKLEEKDAKLLFNLVSKRIEEKVKKKKD